MLSPPTTNMVKQRDEHDNKNSSNSLSPISMVIAKVTVYMLLGILDVKLEKKKHRFGWKFDFAREESLQAVNF